MSYKDVFDVFKRERRLNDDETAFLNSLRHMTDAERELLAETLGPPAKAKSARPTTKKFKKCDVCGVSKRAAHHRDADHPDYHVFDEGAPKTTEKKSARATGMAAQLNKSLESQRQVAVGGFADDTDMLRCSDCGAESDDNVHHKKTDDNYHPFVSSSSAPSAVAQSSTSGSEASSGTGLDAVSSAVGG